MSRPPVRFIIVMLLVSMLTAARALAETCDVSASDIDDDFVAVMEAPFDMEAKAAWLTAGSLAVMGASIAWWDDDLDRAVHDRHPAWQPFHKLSWVAGWYGERGRNAIFASTLIVGTVAAGGALADEDEVVDTALLMGEALVFSMGIDAVLKLLFGRSRPHTGDGPHAFDPFQSPWSKGKLSFPSGHTAATFAMAGVAAGRHPEWYVEVPAYTLAAAAGFERIESHSHWLSDVIGGALLGYAVAELLVELHPCDGDASDDVGGPTFTFSFSF